MTGYSNEDYYRDTQLERQMREWELVANGKKYKCPICGEILNSPSEYHSDECELIRYFPIWQKQQKENGGA